MGVGKGAASKPSQTCVGGWGGGGQGSRVLTQEIAPCALEYHGLSRPCLLIWVRTPPPPHKEKGTQDCPGWSVLIDTWFPRACLGTEDWEMQRCPWPSAKQGYGVQAVTP